jgi:uncharacterized protein
MMGEVQAHRAPEWTKSFFAVESGVTGFPIPMATLRFHVVPNAKENRVVGQHGNSIKVKLKAKPIEGEANAALCKFLAAELGIPERSVVLERGQKSRDKVVRLEGFNEETVRARLLP